MGYSVFVPNRNVIKQYAVDSYYHLYNRGVNKCTIFVDDEDYSVFLNLFKRYLSNSPIKDRQSREYPWLKIEIQLLAFCLMPNHFHMLVYQREVRAMTDLLRGVCVSYTVYFNKKHKRVGHLFQGPFKASKIEDDSYLLHISRYIHLNPKEYLNWNYSSLPYYVGKKTAEWIDPEPVLELFQSEREYENFMSDYRDYKSSLKELKKMVAG